MKTKSNAGLFISDQYPFTHSPLIFNELPRNQNNPKIIKALSECIFDCGFILSVLVHEEYQYGSTVRIPSIGKEEKMKYRVKGMRDDEFGTYEMPVCGTGKYLRISYFE